MKSTKNQGFGKLG